MKATIDISGLKRLAKIAPQIILKELDKGAKIGLVDIQRDARRVHRFNRKSGNAQRSVIVDFKTFARRPAGGIYLELGIAPYAGYIHTGTRPHKIYARNKKALSFTMGSKTIMVPKNPRKMPGYLADGSGDKNTIWSQKGFVEHPGTKPDPFLYEAAVRGKAGLMSQLNLAIKKAVVKINNSKR